MLLALLTCPTLSWEAQSNHYSLVSIDWRKHSRCCRQSTCVPPVICEGEGGLDNGSSSHIGSSNQRLCFLLFSATCSSIFARNFVLHSLLLMDDAKQKSLFRPRCTVPAFLRTCRFLAIVRKQTAEGECDLDFFENEHAILRGPRVHCMGRGCH